MGYRAIPMPFACCGAWECSAMTETFCHASPQHAGQVVPLIVSIAPRPLTVVYGDRYLEPYLAHAFARNLGHFGHARHRLVLQHGRCRGVVATLSAQQKNGLDLGLLCSVLRFYPGLSGAGVIRRLLRSVAGHPKPSADALFIYNLVVAPEARGKGLGRRLLHMALESARAGGQRRVELDVEAGNTAAISLYHAQGFKAMAELPGACCGDWQFPAQLRLGLAL
ncbi:GNAT family N-acetyltransferase [Pantoea sp. Tr-811]|nr:GNAT family N-acetyltransferase [Pantoea sp. Tr-811]